MIRDLHIVSNWVYGHMLKPGGVFDPQGRMQLHGLFYFTTTWIVSEARARNDRPAVHHGQSELQQLSMGVRLLPIPKQFSTAHSPIDEYICPTQVDEDQFRYALTHKRKRTKL